MIDTDFCLYIDRSYSVIFFLVSMVPNSVSLLLLLSFLSLSADVVVLCIYFEVIHQYLHTHTENICGCKTSHL